MPLAELADAGVYAEAGAQVGSLLLLGPGLMGADFPYLGPMAAPQNRFAWQKHSKWRRSSTLMYPRDALPHGRHGLVDLKCLLCRLCHCGLFGPLSRFPSALGKIWQTVLAHTISVRHGPWQYIAQRKCCHHRKKEPTEGFNRICMLLWFGSACRRLCATRCLLLVAGCLICILVWLASSRSGALLVAGCSLLVS